MGASIPDDPTRDLKLQLADAMARKVRVRLQVGSRSDPNSTMRSFEGIPIDFVPAADGRTRVVIEIAAGESVQMVLIERIAMVTEIDP
ncbi:MAG: hypothetical protein Q8Q09_02800 [Deltaproteobacteria bacterium]|nr:hypothetical protein [Deltaproteobacteria bacterium]